MENTNSKGVAVYKETNTMLDVIFRGGNIKALIEFCTPIAQSGISSFARPEQVAAVALWSKSKSIDLIDALSHCTFDKSINTKSFN